MFGHSEREAIQVLKCSMERSHPKCIQFHDKGSNPSYEKCHGTGCNTSCAVLRQGNQSKPCKVVWLKQQQKTIKAMQKSMTREAAHFYGKGTRKELILFASQCPHAVPPRVRPDQ